MSLALQAAAFGGVLAFLIFLVLQRVANRIEASNPSDQSRQTARILRAVAYFDVLFIPIVVYVAMRSAGH